MNYKPGDLKRITFSKALLCGYCQSQVDKIIEKIIDDMKEYEEEITKLNNEIELMEGKVQHYRTIEESLQHTLLIAQHTSDTIKNNALEKASTIIKDAEVRAQKIINDAHNEVVKIKQNYEDIKRSVLAFKSKSESLIRSQLDVMSGSIEENTNDG